MTNLNRITLIGNTGKDEPKTGATQSGTGVTRLTLATNKRYEENGEWKSRVVWHRIVAFGALAERAAKIPKGSLLFVEGELVHREYERKIETAKGPVKVQWPIAEIVASSIGLLSDRRKEKEAAA